METTPKKLWHFPWKYKESIIISIFLLLIGFIIEYIYGGAHFNLPIYPYNFIILIGLVFVIIVIQLFIKHPIVKWVSSIYAAVSVISVFLVLILCMGFIKQGAQPSSTSLVNQLGLTHVVSSFPYLILSVFLLIVLGFTAIRRLFPLSVKNFGFFLNHAGLFIVIGAASFGASDTTTVYMTVKEGQTEWQVYDEKGKYYEMPLAINLIRFSKADYPPSLYLVDAQSGKISIDKKNEKLPEVSQGAKCNIGNWKVLIETFIPKAKKFENSFVSSTDTILTAAAYVSAIHSESGAKASGWLCCEGEYIAPQTLTLDSNTLLYMAFSSAKEYKSDVKIYTKDQKIYSTTIAVNKPYTVEGWKIYQHSYRSGFKDGEHTSTFQFINDPWLYAVFTGIFMMLGGGLFLFWHGKSRNKSGVTQPEINL